MPSSRSKPATVRETACCVTPRSRAASVNEPRLATATNALRALRSSTTSYCDGTTSMCGRCGYLRAMTSHRFGLGLMGMSDLYGPADRSESIATIHAALDAGVTFLDTGDFYGMGHNEMLLREALQGRSRDDVTISVKFGGQRDPAGAFLGFDARPRAVKASLAYSLQRLGTDHIDVYRPARLDPDTPIEETMGAIAELIEAGYVRRAG